MKKTKLFMNISVKYWLHHKKRLLVFFAAVALGTAGICSSALLVRTEKKAVLENLRVISGEYEIKVNDADKEKIISFLDEKDGIDYGSYDELGYAKDDSGSVVHVACFPDKKSEEMYHMTCIKGHYPQNDNEMTIDVSVAKSFGIRPETGQHLKLKYYSYDNKEMYEKEYIISGLFQASNPEAYGGWLRYPTRAEIETVNMPGLFLYASERDRFDYKNITAFIQVNSGESRQVEELASQISSELGDYVKPEQIDVFMARNMANAEILGKNDDLSDEEQNRNRLKDTSGGIKDFYSGVLMPVFVAIVFIIVALSVWDITKNLIEDRREQFAILRCLGLDKSDLRKSIMIDLLVLTAIFISFGIVIGSLVHIGVVCILNKLCNLSLEFGFNCEQVIKSVTYNPILISAVIVLTCCFVSIIFAVIKYTRVTPLQMLQKSKTIKNKSHSIKKEYKPYKSWKSLLSDKVNMHDHKVALISVLVMSAALFGYTYFCALADKNSSEFKVQKQEYGLSGWDYRAEKSRTIHMYEFNIENRHSYGITQDNYESLRENKLTSDCVGAIKNNSTRLVFDEKKIGEKELSALEKYSLKKYDISEVPSDFDKALKDAENAMVRACGYSDSDKIFSLPTIGLNEADLNDLDKWIVQGQIDIQRLNSGQAVILVMSQQEYEAMSDLFKVSQKLPLSDIILDDSEEDLNFGGILPQTIKDPVYSKDVVTPEGEKVPLSSFAFGKRHDIQTRIDAIAVFDEEAADRYMLPMTDEGYAMAAYCSFSEFDAWGLPDSKITDIKLKLNEKASIEDADAMWYSAISGAKGITTVSISEIAQNMNKGTQKIMSIYYGMIISLLLIGSVMICISLYTDIRIRRNKFALMRACGMSVGQLTYLVLRQNIYYPLIGIMFSIVPVAVCQKFFDYIAEMVDSGKWEGQSMDGVPWYHYVPFRYSLYKYNLPLCMFIIFIVYVFVLLLITLFQAHLIRKRQVVDELTLNSF